MNPKLLLSNTTQQQVCDRGTYILLDKFTEVRGKGGKGVVLLNVPGGRTDFFSLDFGLPYVQLGAVYRDAVLAYAGTGGASATLGGQRMEWGVTAPAMASFSSRGPSPVGNNVIMKPDVTAPGVCVMCVLCVGAGVHNTCCSRADTWTMHVFYA